MMIPIPSLYNNTKESTTTDCHTVLLTICKSNVIFDVMADIMEVNGTSDTHLYN